MGTRVRVALCPRAPGDGAQREAAAAVEAAFAEFERLNGLWSNWLPASEVSRVNAQAGAAPVAVSPETFEVLRFARDGSAFTTGLFDISFSPLGEIWTFDSPPGSHTPTRLARVPTSLEVASRLARVDWRALELDATTRTARLARRDMSIHLGGIGKGAAVDRVVGLLRSRGFRDFCVQAGGDLYCAGRNGERPWRVGIAHPRQAGAILGHVDLEEAAFSTSGDYERFAIVDGRRFHHILDTRTGWPATASQSVTALAPSATLAEVLTKAAFILGGADGLALLEAGGARGVIVDAQGAVWQSDGVRLQRGS